MKIAHIIAHIEKGGAEQQLRYIIENTKSEKFQHQVLCLFPNITEWELPENVKIVPIKRSSKYNLISLGFSIYKSLKKLSPDLIHLWLPEILTIPSAISGSLLGFPILSGHRRSPDKFVSIELFLRDRAQYIAHLLSDKLVVNFRLKEKKSLFRAIYKIKDGVYIANGIDLKKIRNLPSKIFGVNQSDTFKVVFAGRLTIQKRVDILIDAILGLLNKGLNISLDIFGEGSEKNKIKEKIHLNNLSSSIQLRGFRSDWLSFAKSSDLFVLPSISEGMSNVLMEAAAVELPIIASDIIENKQIFEHGESIWLTKSDEQSIQSAILFLYQRKELRSKLASNANLIIDRYSCAQMVNKYEELYSNLVDK